MKEADFEDELGRKYHVYLPEGISDVDAHLGIVIGPPDIVDDLELPEPLATRLHNVLHRRGLWNYDEVQKRPKELLASWQEALRVDIQTLQLSFKKFQEEDS